MHCSWLIASATNAGAVNLGVLPSHIIAIYCKCRHFLGHHQNYTDSTHVSSVSVCVYRWSLRNGAGACIKHSSKLNVLYIYIYIYIYIYMCVCVCVCVCVCGMNIR